MNSDVVNNYIKNLEEHIFLMMQLLKQDYMTIMMMPINRFYACLKWKYKFDEEVHRLQEEEMQKAAKENKKLTKHK